VLARPEAIEVEQLAENQRRTVLADAWVNDRVVLERRQRLARLAREIVFPDVERALVHGDIIESLPIGFPERKHRAARGIELFRERLRRQIVEPDLRALGPAISLAPPLRTFAREQEFLAIGRERAVVPVI